MLDDTYDVHQHSPLPVGTQEVPEPDVAVVPAATAFRRPERAFLVVEVADSSLDYDRTVKHALYAAAGVPEYWIVDIGGEQVEVYTQPRGKVYTVRDVVGRDGRLCPAGLPLVEIAVADLFDQREA